MLAYPDARNTHDDIQMQRAIMKQFAACTHRELTIAATAARQCDRCVQQVALLWCLRAIYTRATHTHTHITAMAQVHANALHTHTRDRAQFAIVSITSYVCAHHHQMSMCAYTRDKRTRQHTVSRACACARANTI